MTVMFIQNPRGFVTTNRENTAELVWDTTFQQKWTEQYSEAQKFLDNAVLQGCEPYVPLLTGILVMTGILGTMPGEGVVSWIAPYARRQYYGKVMAGSPLVATSKDMVYHGGGIRGAFWFERWKEVSGEQAIAGARRIAGGKI